MTMSKVAPEDADEDGGGSHHREGRPGSTLPRKTTAAITSTPTSHSHERRWPKRPRTGRRTVSTSGAHSNLKL